MNGNYNSSGMFENIDLDEEEMHELLESGESSVGKMILKVQNRIFKELKRVILIFKGISSIG